MTIAQEKQYTEEYKQKIRNGLQQGTDEGYLQLFSLCGEDRCHILSMRDKELLLFRRLLSTYLQERNAGYAHSDTIIGKASVFWNTPSTQLSIQQLIKFYTILKFSILRLETHLPEADCVEGVQRVVALGFSPIAISWVTEMEVFDKDAVLAMFIVILENPSISGQFPSAQTIASALRSSIAPAPA